MDLLNELSDTGVSQARCDRAMITGPRLGEIWPGVRIRLIRRLILGGVDSDTAEDIAQEVAVRALACALEYSDVEDFCRWAFTVARNLAIDHTRLRARITTVGEMPERTDTRDVAVEVEQRIQLTQTLAAIAAMREADRNAIVEGVNASGRNTRTVAVRLAVRRHRARARLLRMVEGVAAFWLWVRHVARPDIAVPLTTAASAAVFAVPALLGMTVPATQGGSPSLALRHRVELRDSMLAGSRTQAGPAGLAGGGADARRTAAEHRSAKAPRSDSGHDLARVGNKQANAGAGERERQPEDCDVSPQNLPEPVPTCVNVPSPKPPPPSMLRP